MYLLRSGVADTVARVLRSFLGSEDGPCWEVEASSLIKGKPANASGADSLDSRPSTVL